jgi:hypothetical protein
MRDAMLAYLHAVATAADLGDRAAMIRTRVQERASALQAWAGAYVAADDDGRSLLWKDGTGLGELALDQAGLACFDAVPAILQRVLPNLTAENPRRRPRTCARRRCGRNRRSH